VYDTDEAMNIVHRQQLEIAAFIREGECDPGEF
jgi:hypothetical protein